MRNSSTPALGWNVNSCAVRGSVQRYSGPDCCHKVSEPSSYVQRIGLPISKSPSFSYISSERSIRRISTSLLKEEVLCYLFTYSVSTSQTLASVSIIVMSSGRLPRTRICLHTITNQLASGTMHIAEPLLPITSTFALPLSVYYIFLQIRVTMRRIETQTSLAPQSSASPTSPGASDPLLAAFRTQANFAENVPLALVLAGLVEANNGNKGVLTALLGALTVGRVMHGELGLMTKGSGGIGRPIGFFSTTGVILGLALYGAWLSRCYWHS